MKKAKKRVSGVFENIESTTVIRPGTYWKTIYRFLFTGDVAREPKQPLPAVTTADFRREPASDAVQFAWLGHSSVLVALGNRRVLIDPVFSDRASFLSFLGPKRFQPAPVRAQDLPHLDAVLISHDHYDHLDKRTILELAEQTAGFHVPLGVGAILKRWGIPQSKIQEYAWWDEHVVHELTIVAVPARHFSGRGLFDRNKTLWCSWVVSNGEQQVYHSGDTGMTSQFREIGMKYGPFDIAFVKIAAYHENWPDIHLKPEQAIEAFGDLRGSILVPIHWGTFNLSMHSWHEPIERLVEAADRNKVKIITPMLGELVDPVGYENRYWWRPYMSLTKEHS